MKQIRIIEIYKKWLKNTKKMLEGEHGALLKNTWYLFILFVGNYLINLLLYPFLARILSVEIFGLFGFNMSYFMLFQVVVEYGFIISATGEIASNRDDVKKLNIIVSKVMFSKIFLAMVSVCIFLGGCIIVSSLKENIVLSTLFFLNFVMAAFVPDFYFRGTEQMDLITKRTLIAKTISIMLIITFVRGDNQIYLVPIFLLLGNTMMVLVSLIQIKKDGIEFEIIRVSEIIVVLKSKVFYFFSRLAVSINAMLASFVLGECYSPTSIDVAYFSGCAKVESAMESSLSPIFDSLYPHMVKQKDYKLYKKVFIFGGILWTVIVVIVYFYASDICMIILGEKYKEAYKCFRVLLLGAWFSFPSQILGYPGLNPIGKEFHANIALCISTILAVGASIVAWQAECINLITMSYVISFINVFNASYRGFVFIKYKRLIKEK